MAEISQSRLVALGKSAIVVASVVIALFATSPVTLGLLTGTSNPISSTGIIASVGVGIYTTQQCTANLTQISWGTLSPGSNYTKTGYIRNNGSTNMTLALSTANWNPTGANVIGLTWNYGGIRLIPGQVLAVTWKLIVPSTITGVQNFSFNIVVSGSG